MKSNKLFFQGGSKLMIVLVLLGLLLAACAPAQQGAPQQPTSEQTPSPQAPAPTTPVQTETPANPAVQAALRELAAMLNIDIGRIQVVEAEAVEWTDSCLGLGGPAEMCLMAITPGYRVTLELDGETHVFHTNNDGSAIRYAQAVPGPGSGPLPIDPNNLPGAVQNARLALAQQLQVGAEQISVVTFEAVQWPDGCLGVQRPGIMCTQAIVPGYRVILEQGGKQYEFRTDEGGGSVIQADQPLSMNKNQVLTWEYTEDGACQRVEVGPAVVNYGACGEALNETLLSPERRAELRHMLSRYSGFAADTMAGFVSFEGTGNELGNEAEFRSLAEWGKQVAQEAQAADADEEFGLALTWSRQGGIAGFCDDLNLYLSGWAKPADCKASQIPSDEGFRLEPDQLTQLYAWIDRYQPFEYIQQDPAGAADAMTIGLKFDGQGQETASAQVQAEIAAFVAEVYTQSSK